MTVALSLPARELRDGRRAAEADYVNVSFASCGPPMPPTLNQAGLIPSFDRPG